MFIQQAFRPGNKFWKYLVGSLIIIITSSLGQIPLIMAVMIKATTNGDSIPMTEAGIMTYLDLNLTLFLLLLSFTVVLPVLWLVVRNMHEQKFKEIITSRPKVDWRRVFFAFGIWGVFSVISVLATYFLEPESYVLQFDPLQFALLFIIATLMVPLQTSVEELVFRGYLMQGFGLLAKNRWFPLLLTSVIFGGLHFFNPEVGKMGEIIVLYYIATGLLLGVMTLMDEGMELALGFHAANNLIAALMVTADWTVFQTHSVFKDISNPSVGADVLLPVVIIYPLLLFVFSRKYKWRGWSEKLTGKLQFESEEFNKIGHDHE